MRSNGAGAAKSARSTSPAGIRPLRHVLGVLLAVLLPACAAPAVTDGEAAGAPSNYPGPPDGINMIALRYLEPGADPVALAVELRPDEADYAEVFRLDRVA